MNAVGCLYEGTRRWCPGCLFVRVHVKDPAKETSVHETIGPFRETLLFLGVLQKSIFHLLGREIHEDFLVLGLIFGQEYDLRGFSGLLREC